MKKMRGIVKVVGIAAVLLFGASVAGGVPVQANAAPANAVSTQASRSNCPVENCREACLVNDCDGCGGKGYIDVDDDGVCDNREARKDDERVGGAGNRGNGEGNQRRNGRHCEKGCYR